MNHWSDCATHNMPAYPNGPCDCVVEHPVNCGGQYNGIGFMDAAQQRHRARCVNHGGRLVETETRHGPYKYVTDSAPLDAISEEGK